MDDTRTLDGKTALVTGATSGIGFQTASALALLGAVVYITGRDLSRGQEATAQLRKAAGHEAVYFIRADASTVGGNQNLAKHMLAETDQLHILVNNVGGLYNDRMETSDCYEATLAMNLVGPFALTAALMPALQRSGQARIVNVTSMAYQMWKGDPFADIHSTQSYLGSDAYARSKLLNLLWTFALARCLEGSGIVANATHPGMAWTTMIQNNEPRLMPPVIRLFWPIFRLMQRNGSVEKAARSSIYLASAPEAAHATGKYFESDTRPKTPVSPAVNRANEEKTWELAALLVNNAPTSLPSIDVTMLHPANQGWS